MLFSYFFLCDRPARCVCARERSPNEQGLIIGCSDPRQRSREVSSSTLKSRREFNFLLYHVTWY